MGLSEIGKEEDFVLSSDSASNNENENELNNTTFDISLLQKEEEEEETMKKEKFKNKEKLNIVQFNMQKSSILELDRIANELKADIIVAEETGIENSEKRET